jgi:hypothetical protein
MDGIAAADDSFRDLAGEEMAPAPATPIRELARERFGDNEEHYVSALRGYFDSSWKGISRTKLRDLVLLRMPIGAA